MSHIESDSGTDVGGGVAINDLGGVGESNISTLIGLSSLAKSSQSGSSCLALGPQTCGAPWSKTVLGFLTQGSHKALLLWVGHHTGRI